MRRRVRHSAAKCANRQTLRGRQSLMRHGSDPEAAMPILIVGGPLDGGSFSFSEIPPARFVLDVPARCGGPGEAVYVLKPPGPAYHLVAYRDVDGDPGDGTA
jgi:hypothetical protein